MDIDDCHYNMLMCYDYGVVLARYDWFFAVFHWWHWLKGFPLSIAKLTDVSTNNREC